MQKQRPPRPYQGEKGDDPARFYPVQEYSYRYLEQGECVEKGAAEHAQFLGIKVEIPYQIRCNNGVGNSIEHRETEQGGEERENKERCAFNRQCVMKGHAPQPPSEPY